MGILTTSRIEQWKLAANDLLLNAIGWAMNRVHSPARIRPFEYVDPGTDETIYLYTDKRLSVLCVGPRRYYFDRVTGRFDGVSSDVMGIAGRVELFD